MASLAEISDKSLIVRDPDDETVVGETAVTPLGDLDRILERGYRASREIAPPAHERARVLHEVADRVASDAEGHARLIAREGIKTIREARAEVKRAIETLRLSSEEAKRIGGSVVPLDQVPSGEGRIGWWVHRPAGLVVAITPYNDPLNLVAHKLGPAFAAGCPIILKPHPQTPFSALRLVEHFHASGAGEDRIQIVIGGAELGAALVTDERPRIISFTGGREAGNRIARGVGLKQLLLELGGVGVVAVASDADLDLAADAISSGAFWAAGQNCVRAQRIVIDESAAGELREKLAARARQIRVGPKLDEATDMGPLVDCALANSLSRSASAMVQAGGTVLAEGEIDGIHMQPTWITGLPSGHPSLAQELFGPVATIEAACDGSDLLNQLSGGAGAIHAAIFTRSINMATAAFQRCGPSRQRQHRLSH